MKAIVLLSGGMDSATVLALIVQKYGNENVMAVGFNYGQKHASEHKYAKRIADHFGVRFVNLSVDDQTFEGNKSALLNQNVEIEHDSYKNIIDKSGTGIVDTYVPFRNGLMLSQVASLAYSQEASVIAYGAHKDDYAGDAYPDCSPEFYEAMNKAIYLGTGKKVKIEAPLIDLDKTGVCKLGHELQVPFEFTRSCYEGGEKSCGKCATCRDRINAFKNNGLVDPIPYEIDINWGYNSKFMEHADFQARLNIITKEGGPFGSVIVKDGKAIAYGWNQVLKNDDPTAHGEIQAIRKACKMLKTHDLSGCELYTNAEPCPMCFSAIAWANIDKVYFGNTAKDADEIGFRDKKLYDYFAGEKEAPFKISNRGRDLTIETFKKYKESQHELY